MKLVIAEKPSVAQSLARVIGADKRQDGYLVSWCVGHLVELSARSTMMSALPSGDWRTCRSCFPVRKPPMPNTGNCGMRRRSF